MDVTLTREQTEIVRQVRRFLDNESPMKYVRAMFDDQRGFSDRLWAGIAEMGWTAMRLPEEFSGLNMPFVDLCLVLEEMGRALLPGPFFSTVLLAADALVQAGTPAQKAKYLPGIAEGKIRGTLALYEPDSGADPGYVRMAAEFNGNEFVLSGTKLFVPDVQCANFIVVAARTAPACDSTKAISLFCVDLPDERVSIAPLRTMDGTRKLFAVEFRDVRVGEESVLGQLHEGWSSLRPVLQRAQVGICADSVGAAQKSMEMAADYAKIRIQFDQPIGAYQAVKHRCAQMFEAVESARSLMYWAAWAQDEADPQEAALAASSAKSYCCEVGTSVSTSAIQVLGATGFSWEHDIHLFLKRAKANEMVLGDPVYHREQVALILAG